MIRLYKSASICSPARSWFFGRLYSSKANKKPSQVKEVILSWLISKNDLETQKRKAIESILSKGNKLQLRLENRNRKFYQPSANELEARQILLDRVNKMVEEAGGIQAKPPQGSMVTRMMLYFQQDPSKQGSSS